MLTTDEVQQASIDLEKDAARNIITVTEVQAGRVKLQQEHSEWLAGVYGIEHLSQEVKNATYAFAWAQGHSSGFYDVASCYGDVADLVLLSASSRN